MPCPQNGTGVLKGLSGRGVIFIPFRGQQSRVRGHTSQISSSLSPKRDYCRLPSRGNTTFHDDYSGGVAYSFFIYGVRFLQVCVLARGLIAVYEYSLTNIFLKKD